MRNNTSLLKIVIALSAPIFFYSCRKSGQEPVVLPFKIERINIQNFHSLGWKEQQVNVAGTTTTFSDSSDNVAIVCGPEYTGFPWLTQGCVTMNLPTSADPTLRRIRLRRGGYSGTFLKELTVLKYSTYVVQNAPVNMVLQIDINGDETKDFNIFFEPRPEFQNAGAKPLILNQWQQWDALSGLWYPEVSTISGLPTSCTIGELVTLYPTARIIDTEPIGHNGEGVRFTIGGSPRSLFDNTIGYFDALIIGTKNKQPTLFDFTCNQGK